MKRLGPSLLLPAALMLLAALVFFTGITWGLPSRAVDPFLFGGRPAWSGRQIVALAGPGEADPNRASNVSANPIGPHDRPVVVNATDAERARIVRRYRLMSYQPDEWTTLAALASMNPSRGSFDPRLYQYGGPWVYGVGALLRAASAARLVQLTPDPAWYLDHPDAFGRFYVVARAYSAAWGLAGVLAVWLIVRRILGYSAGAAAATAAGALCYIGMPAVVNAAHEAKPHLAGAVLMLFTVLAAARYADGERGRTWILPAILAGLALGMVPSALPVLLVLPAAEMLRARHVPGQRSGMWMRAARGMGTALVVYLIVNPYVAIHLFWQREVLRSNFGNTAGFYRASWWGGGLPNAALLAGVGASFVLAAAGIAGGCLLAVRAFRRRGDALPHEVRRRTTGLLLAVPTLVAGGQFALFAAGKPGEYARLGLPFDLLLLVEAIVAIATFIRTPQARLAAYLSLVVTTAFSGALYVRGFVRDCSQATATRVVAAGQIRSMLGSGAGVLASSDEPAPWSLPPVDLFRWRIVLPPRDAQGTGSVRGARLFVEPVDLPPGREPAAIRLLGSTPLSWAAKPFQILGR